MSAKSLSKMLVKDLKEELDKRGLNTQGLKAELVKRLEDAMKSESQPNEEGPGKFCTHKPDLANSHVFFVHSGHGHERSRKAGKPKSM